MNLEIAHYSDPHVRKTDKDEILRILDFIYGDCNERRVNATFCTGDIFDGPITLGDDGPLNELLDLMLKLNCPHYILQGTPSHDRPGSIKIFDKLARQSGRQVYQISNAIGFPLKAFKPENYLIPDFVPADCEPCGYISFLPAPTKGYLAHDLVGTPEEINDGIRQKLRAILASFAMAAADYPRPHILCGHFTVVGAKTPTGQTLTGGDISISVSDIELAKADYIALGHIHEANQPGLPDYISYAGPPLHLNYGELTPRGFKVVTFKENGTLDNIEFVETPSTPRQVIDVFIDGDITTWSEEICGRADVRIRIQGQEHQLTESRIAEIEKIILAASPHSFKVEKIFTIETRVRASELTKAKTLRDKLIQYGQVKDIAIPESVLEKADQLEEVIV